MRQNKPVSRIVTAVLAVVLALTGTIAAAPAQPATAASSPLASCENLNLLKKIGCVRDALKKTAGVGAGMPGQTADRAPGLP
ncbi:hypothetical protein [Streptomyces sp. SudanB148_2056]|uniref:hypothetical protein n=1 Tax=Streptomyces sp. SudanB148_2056 TaxID=3035280 RepID=UPI003F56B145